MDDDRQLFEDIIRGQEIRGQEMRDEGIVSFDQDLRDLKEHIREKYIKRGFTDIPEEDKTALLERINDRWPFDEEIATVSGRLEVFSHSAVDDEVIALLGDVAVSDDYGEIVHDESREDGVRYINVDGAKLYSAGIDLDIIRDGEGKLVDIEVGYQFYHLEDKDGEIPLFARYLDLHIHHYDTPSPTEARVRLENLFPRQYEMLEAILTNGESAMSRIILVEETLRDDLSDQTFRMLVELYVNDELHFDMKFAYMALVKDSVTVMDDIDSQSAMWQDIEITGVMSISVAAPEVHFSSPRDNDSNEIRAYIFGMSYNDMDGEKPEMVGIPAINIEQFHSTRTRGGIAQRAIEAMDIQIEQDMQIFLQQSGEVRFSQIEAAKEDTTPNFIRQLEFIEDALDRVYRLGDEYRSHTFATPEDAQRDANNLRVKMQEQLNGTTFFDKDGHLVEVMGDRVQKPNHSHYLEWDDEKKAYIHGLNPDAPSVGLLPGEKAVGYTGKLYSMYEPVPALEGDNEAAFFVPVVVLGVHVSEQGVASNDNGPIFSELIARNQVAVTLDSSVDIQLTLLEQYRANQEALLRAEKTYGPNSPLMGRIRQLEEAFGNENPEDFTSIDPVLFTRFNIDLKRAVRRHRHPVEPAYAALDTMLSERNIIASSNVYTRKGGEYILDEALSNKLNGWKVMDLQPSHDGASVMAFVKQPNKEEYRYLALDSLTDFRF